MVVSIRVTSQGANAQSVTSAMMAESWLPVVGWESLYEVSDLGRVRSLRRSTAMGWRGGNMLRTTAKIQGYPVVSLSNGPTRRTAKVHRLVLEAFAGPCPEGMEALHRDGVREHVTLSNLRWGTHLENVADRANHGTTANSNKTHCPQRHEYTPDNTFIQVSGSRECRICKKRSNAEAQQRRTARRRERNREDA
jgi:HNH endonuclease/NUMOD4 motif